MGNQYSYHDYPDGTHCTYKTAVVARKTTIIGFFIGSLEVINISKPSTIGGALARYPKYMVPGVMTGVAFGITTCTLGMVRQKDDNWNYFFGGAAMGSVFGIARRSFAVGTPCTVLFALAAVCYKEYINSEMATYKRHRNWNGTWDSLAYDFTLTPELPKYTRDMPSDV